MTERLISVEGKNFTAAFISNGRVIRCAPILRKALLGKTDDEARAIIKAKGWRATIIEPKERP